MNIYEGIQNNQGKECPKCAYVRKADEFAPEWQCPKCQIVYEKYKPEVQSVPDYPQDAYQDAYTGSPVQSSHSGSMISSILKISLALLVMCAAGYLVYSQLFDYGYRRADEVVVFTSADCAPCKDLFRLLDKYKVEYTAYDVYASDENMRLFKEEGRDLLPLLLVGRHKVEGFDEERIGTALDGVMEDFVDKDGDVKVVMYSTTT